MKKTIDFYDFDRAFRDANLRHNFTYHSLRALFEMLTKQEKDSGEEIELDVQALCTTYRDKKDEQGNLNIPC